MATRFTTFKTASQPENEMISYHTDEEISFEEYHAFLKRTDLGSQYPKERFRERVSKTLSNRSISITARNEDGLLVGVCFGLSEFAYFLFFTDLGVDRRYVRKGIGKELIQRAQDAAGGEDDISVVTVSNDKAIGFYEKQGYRSGKDVLWKPCKVWTGMVID